MYILHSTVVLGKDSRRNPKWAGDQAVAKEAGTRADETGRWVCTYKYISLAAFRAYHLPGLGAAQTKYVGD